MEESRWLGATFASKSSDTTRYDGRNHEQQHLPDTAETQRHDSAVRAAAQVVWKRTDWRAVGRAVGQLQRKFGLFRPIESPRIVPKRD